MEGDASSPPTYQHPPSPADQTWQGRAGAWPGRAGCLSAIQLGRETLPLSVFVSQISRVATVGAGLTWFCLQDGSRWAEEGRSGMPSAGHQGAGQARCISSRRWAALAGEPPCGLAQGRPGTGEPTRGAEGGGQGWGSRTLRVSGVSVCAGVCTVRLLPRGPAQHPSSPRDTCVALLPRKRRVFLTLGVQRPQLCALRWEAAVTPSGGGRTPVCKR